MLRYRQSSLCFCRCGSRRRRCSSLPAGIRRRASVSLCTSGGFWGQTGAGRSAIRMPFQCVGVPGGMKRMAPVGAEAYGTPRNTSTGWRLCRRPPSGLTIEPFRAPYLVVTVRELRRPEPSASQGPIRAPQKATTKRSGTNFTVPTIITAAVKRSCASANKDSLSSPRGVRGENADDCDIIRGIATALAVEDGGRVRKEGENHDLIVDDGNAFVDGKHVAERGQEEELMPL